MHMIKMASYLNWSTIMSFANSTKVFIEFYLVFLSDEWLSIFFAIDNMNIIFYERLSHNLVRHFRALKMKLFCV